MTVYNIRQSTMFVTTSIITSSTNHLVHSQPWHWSSLYASNAATVQSVRSTCICID